MRLIAITILLSSVLGLLNAQVTLAKPEMKTIAPTVAGQKSLPEKTALVATANEEAGPYNEQSIVFLPNGTKVIYQIYKSRGEHEDYLFDVESLAALEAKLYEHYAWGPQGPPGGFTVDLAIHMRNPTVVTRKRRDANAKPVEKFLVVPRSHVKKFYALDKEMKDLMTEVHGTPVKTAYHPRRRILKKPQTHL